MIMSPMALDRIANATDIADLERTCRIEFLCAFHDATPRQIADELQALCWAGDGNLMRPEPGLHHPGTHLYELQVHGVTAVGATIEEAARNWMRACRNLETGREE